MKKTIIKKTPAGLLALLLALIFVLSSALAACGGTTPAETGTEKDSDTQPGGVQSETDKDTEPDSETEPSEEEPPVPENINLESPYPVKRIDLYTTELSSYRIVVASDAGSYVRGAAAELQKYLMQAAGYDIPIVTDAEAASDCEILVGPTNRDTAESTARRAAVTNDGVVYYVQNGKLYLGSNSELGNYYAVYHFLEDWVGFRCWSNHSETIYDATYIRIPKDLDYNYSSPLMYRHTDWGLSTATRLKWGLNAEQDTHNSIVGFCHTMGALSGTSNDSQPCLSDENVYQTVLANVRAWIESHPGCRFISVTQNDNQDYCICTRCAALAEQENQSGVMLNFVNRLADDIKDDYPDVYLVTFAYQYTRKPPTTIVPRDNVIMWMCSIECCFSHTLDDPDCEQNTEFCEDLEGWRKITDRILFWDYTTNYHMYILPYPDLMVIDLNAKYLTEAGAIGIYEEGNYQNETSGEFSELRGYLLSHLLWNPTMSREEYIEMMQEYLKGYFGPGWKSVYEYIVQTSEKVAEHHMGITYCLEDGFLFETEEGNPDSTFIRKMVKLWDKAYSAAETDEQRTHIVTCRLQCDAMGLLGNWYTTKKRDPDATRAYFERLQATGCYYYAETFTGDYNRTVPFLLERQVDRLPQEWRH